MPYRFNPFTGRLDDVGTAGGGSGTVTAVAGGVGITNTPDPIVGVGSVNLDINDLTLESSLAAGDLFAFVDVSSGTTFADQRKTTLGDIAAFIGSSSGADCTTAPTLLCLAGRTGATNNPLLSTDSQGVVTGTDATNVFTGGLSLHTSSGADWNLDLLLINDHKTTLKGVAGVFAFGNQNINIDGSTPLFGFIPPTLIAILFGSPQAVWTVIDDTTTFNATLMAHSPRITNPPGQPKNLGSATLIQSFVNYHADGAACSVSGWQQADTIPMFSTANGGTLSVPNFLGVDVGYEADSGVDITTAFGFRYLPRGRNGSFSIGTIQDDIAFWVIDDQVNITGKHLSFYSQGPTRIMRHLGPVVFGVDADPTGAFALEVIGDVHISGKLTLDGALDPTDILYSGQLTSTIVSGTAPMVIASTDMVANLNADLLDGLHAVDFAQVLAPPVRLTAQAADIADTPIISTAGLYRVEVYALDTTADLTAGAITVHIKFTDGSGSRDVAVGPVALTALTGVASSTIFARLASGDLTYGVTHTGLFGSAAYALDITTERLAA